MRMKIWTLVLALGVLLLLPGAAVAQQGGTLNAVDREFVLRAWQSNQFEIITGQLGEEKATTESVAEIAEIIFEDHTGAQAELVVVAQELGVTLPTALTSNQQREVARLQRLSGELFEVAWLQSQIRAHRTAVRVTKRQAKRGANRELRNFAIDVLPILGEHLGALSHQQDDLERGED